MQQGSPAFRQHGFCSLAFLIDYALFKGLFYEVRCLDSAVPNSCPFFQINSKNSIITSSRQSHIPQHHFCLHSLSFSTAFISKQCPSSRFSPYHPADDTSDGNYHIINLAINQNNPLLAIILLQLMQNQENFDPNTINQIYNSMIFADNQEDLCLPFHSLHHCPLNEQDSELPQKNDIFSNPIDHLSAQSFYTVSRGSLQIVPEQHSMDVNTKLQEVFASTIKSIESSFIFHQQEDQEENERKLIIKTEELTLRSSQTQIRDDIFNEYSPKRHRSLLKNLKPKVHIIKQAKQLIKELKREYKYNDSIMADVVLSLNNTILRLKAAKIQPIVSEKGHLSGFIIREGEEEYKVKVLNSKIETFDPSLQLWSESGQAWEQFTFKIKIHNI